MAREQRRIDFKPEAYETVMSFNVTPVIALGDVHRLRTSERFAPGRIEHADQYLSREELENLRDSLSTYLDSVRPA